MVHGFVEPLRPIVIFVYVVSIILLYLYLDYRDRRVTL